MSGTAAIETINVDQIATVTDLLLLRARTSHRRLSSNKLAFAYDRRGARASRPSTSDFRDPDVTMFVRAREIGTSTASAAVVATAFAIAIVLASLL
jgi:hypothetical protein